MSSQLPTIRAQLPSVVNDQTMAVLESLDILYRASYVRLPLHPISLPITRASVAQLRDDLHFQMRWVILLADKQEQLSNTDRERLGPVSAPFTPNSVAQYMEQIKRVEEERTLWSSLSLTSALPQEVVRQRLSCQQLQDPTQAISCGEKDLLHQMRYIPTGLFQMGADREDPQAFDVEKPRHSVAVTIPFWMDSTPVTQSLYTAVMNHNPSRHKIPICPVDNIRWVDAVVFCNRLSRIEGFTPVYPLEQTQEEQLLAVQATTSAILTDFIARPINAEANGYRLPTEAEWEYAATAHQDLPFSGGKALGFVAWYNDNSAQQPHPVAQKNANAFGLYDMCGNVWEWCWDDWTGTPYPNVGNELQNSEPRPATTYRRTIRGGCWYDSAQSLRITHRLGADMLYVDPGQGFRIVRSVRGTTSLAT